jgi:hypothetical protein
LPVSNTDIIPALTCCALTSFSSIVLTMIYLIFLMTLILSRSNHANPIILLITVKTNLPSQQL